MSLPTPTTKQVNDQLIADLEGTLSQTIPLFSKAFARVLAWALAGLQIILFRYCGFIFLQLFVAFASMEETTVGGKKFRPLVLWGRLIGVGDPLAATRAELLVLVAVTNPTGTLKAGEKLTREATGVVYEVMVDVPLTGQSVQARVRATSDQAGGRGEGTIGNLQTGDVLTFVRPSATYASDVEVATLLVAGTDAEQPNVYRRRVMSRFQRRPQGGAYADYRDWAIEVEGIVNVYPYAGDTPGRVGVYCEASTDVDPDGFPTGAMLDDVLATINQDTSGLANRRPVNDKVTAQSITRQTFNFVIASLSPDSPELRQKIEDGLSEHLRSREPFIEGLSVLPRRDRVTLAATSGVVDDIVAANGATIVTMTQAPGPAYTLEHGEKAKLGTITWA